ncbi:hypothetical protein ACVWWK_001577 [Bradyrhizobium sp. LB9.1b]
MPKDFVWSTEKLSILPSDKLRNVRDNAISRGNAELLLLCEAELARRKSSKNVAVVRSSIASPVKGYHLVCRREHGVVFNEDGSFWSGSWVIAKSQVERSERVGAYVALHERQSELSYLQGVIKGWRIAPRAPTYADQERQTSQGVEFLLEPTSTPLAWRGNGTIEKSYWYGVDRREDDIGPEPTNDASSHGGSRRAEQRDGK